MKAALFSERTDFFADAPEGVDWHLSIPAKDLNDSRAVFRNRFDMESDR